MVGRVREVCLLSINVTVLSILSSTHFLKFSLDPLVIHENQYCYIVFWKALDYNINHIWKVKLLYILLTRCPGKENAFIFSPSNISRHAIYFNWFNTQNHIKISWKVQPKCYFTYLPSLKAVYHWDSTYSGKSATSLRIHISISWWRIPRWFTLFLKTLVISPTTRSPDKRAPALSAAPPFDWF